MTSDLSSPPPNIVPPDLWKDFMEWARDGGYDESYFDRWDSKSVALQVAFIAEMAGE